MGIGRKTKPPEKLLHEAINELTESVKELADKVDEKFLRISYKLDSNQYTIRTLVQRTSAMERTLTEIQEQTVRKRPRRHGHRHRRHISTYRN